MKHAAIFLTAILLAAANPLLSYAAAKEHQSTGPETAQQKEQYEKSMEERLRKLGKELDELKAKAATMCDQARKETDRFIAEAEKKQKAASRKLEEMRRESQTKWRKFTHDMNAAMDDFEKAYEKAKAHFKQ